MFFNKKILIVGMGFLSLSCSKNERRSTCNTEINIQYDTCTTNGCTLSISCSPSSVPNFFASSSQIIKNSLGIQSTLKLPATNITLQVYSITINQPSLLQEAAGDAPTNWYNHSIQCTKIGNDVTCPNFLPIANDFTIHGTFESFDVIANITVDNSTLTLVEYCGATICGQNGTTIERMFDCSQRVRNFAGIGNDDGNFTEFTLGNPDPNWFLVSSPSDNDNQQLQCFWLSPIIENSNPAAGSNQFDSNAVPISTYVNSKTKGRFLWSGVGTGYFSFFEVNGYNPRGTISPSYNYYYFNGDSNVMAQQYNTDGTPDITGPFIYSPEEASSAPILSPIICAGSSCYGGDNSIYDLYYPTALAQSQSLCSANIAPGINLFSDSVYVWQVPSYPMAMTLTGGFESSCQSPPSTIGTGQAFCNGGVNAPGSTVGFKANDNIPYFFGLMNPLNSSGSNGSFFWTSSVYDASNAWFFQGNDGAVQNLPMSESGFAGVRCVSASW